MVEMKTQITDLNAKKEIERLNMLIMEDKEKYNTVILRASEEFRDWILDNVSENSWESLRKAVREKDNQADTIVEIVELTTKNRKYDEDPEKFAEALVEEYKKIYSLLPEDLLLRILPKQIYSQNNKLQERLRTCRTLKDLLFTVRELSVSKIRNSSKPFKGHIRKPKDESRSN